MACKERASLLPLHALEDGHSAVGHLDEFPSLSRIRIQKRLEVSVIQMRAHGSIFPPCRARMGGSAKEKTRGKKRDNKCNRPTPEEGMGCFHKDWGGDEAILRFVLTSVKLGRFGLNGLSKWPLDQFAIDQFGSISILPRSFE